MIRLLLWAVAIGSMAGYSLLFLTAPEIAKGCAGHFTLLMLLVYAALVALQHHKPRVPR